MTGPDGSVEARRWITRLVGEIKDCVDKINGYGCICKGVEQGLIDFPFLFGEEKWFFCVGKSVSPTSPIGIASKTVLPDANLAR